MSVYFIFKERMGVAKNLGLEGTQLQTHTLPNTPTSMLQTGKLVSRWQTVARSPAILITVSFEKEAMEYQTLYNETADFVFAVERSKFIAFFDSEDSCKILYWTGNSVADFYHIY